MARHPVLLLVFNRPEFAEQVAQIVVDARPPKVYVASDGARDRAEENVVADTRRRVRDVLGPSGVPVEYLERAANLGCKRAVEGAITWFFGHEPAGMILEDDCHPSPSFFEFCDLMLDRYRDDERIMHISGYSQEASRGVGYRYSRFPAVWGWATWARAWRHHPTALPDPSSVGRARLDAAFARSEHADYFAEKWRDVSRGVLDSWGFAWVYTVRSQSGLAVQPRVNFVRNVGVGDERAVHTVRPDQTVATNAATTVELAGHLDQPSLMLPDDTLDHEYFRARISGRLPILKAAYRRLRFMLGSRW